MNPLCFYQLLFDSGGFPLTVEEAKAAASMCAALARVIKSVGQARFYFQPGQY